MRHTEALRAFKRITILKTDPRTGVLSVEVIRGKRKKKKQSKSLRMFERLARQHAAMGQSTSNNYLKRHHKSNRERKNGWARDYAYNLLRAIRRGGRKIKPWKLFA
jgi:hypothetical protein